MSITSDVRNALSLLRQGELREFIFRIRVHLQKIDLKNTYLDELNLSQERCHYHANSGGVHLAKVLRALQITPRDSIVDFGSGKGGALITLARYPFAKIAGVEISPRLVEIARENLRKLGLGEVDMTVGDAADFRDLDDYNYFYFFSPFPSVVMQAVMKNIADSLARLPRKAVIIYFNPSFHDDVVAGAIFEKVREFHHHDLGYFIYSNRP